MLCAFWADVAWRPHEGVYGVVAIGIVMGKGVGVARDVDAGDKQAPFVSMILNN